MDPSSAAEHVAQYLTGPFRGCRTLDVPGRRVRLASVRQLGDLKVDQGDLVGLVEFESRSLGRSEAEDGAGNVLGRRDGASGSRRAGV